MKTINWQRLLDTNGVSYITRGANVKRGELAIKCPFCGNADPSFHMGLNLDTGWWACWRNQNHRGKSPVRLLVKLLRVSYYKARELAGLDNDYIDPEGFDAVIARIMKQKNIERIEEVKREFLDFPKEFVQIKNKGSTKRFHDYLSYRDFDNRGIETLFNDYLVTATVSGSYKDRIIIPYLMDKELVTWTSRAIAEAAIRYKNLSIDESIFKPHEILFNFDASYKTNSGEILIITEGPFDALKLDLYGKDYGVRAMALSTNAVSDDQIFLIEEVSPNFTKVLVMMDNSGAIGAVDSMKMKSKLSQIRNIGFVRVPDGYKDAGELPPKKVKDFCKGLQ